MQKEPMQRILKSFSYILVEAQPKGIGIVTRGCHNAYLLLEYSIHKKDTTFCCIYRLFREEC